MPKQLIYTSSKQGLDLGRSGYCTVARTTDMSKLLSIELEKISVFDFNTNYSNYVFSYRTIQAGTSLYYVCSKISNCGFDYTGRSNFIAHHVAFTQDEISKYANPADFILNWNGWITSWEKESCELNENDFLTFTPTPNLTSTKTWASYSSSENANFLDDGKLFGFIDVNEENFLRLLSESFAIKKNSWLYSFTTRLQESEQVRNYSIILFSDNKITSENILKVSPKTYVKNHQKTIQTTTFDQSITISPNQTSKKKVITPNSPITFSDTSIKKSSNSYIIPLISASLSLSVILFTIIYLIYDDENEIKDSFEKTLTVPSNQIYTQLPKEKVKKVEKPKSDIANSLPVKEQLLTGKQPTNKEKKAEKKEKIENTAIPVKIISESDKLLYSFFGINDEKYGAPTKIFVFIADRNNSNKYYYDGKSFPVQKDFPFNTEDTTLLLSKPEGVNIVSDIITYNNSSIWRNETADPSILPTIISFKNKQDDKNFAVLFIPSELEYQTSLSFSSIFDSTLCPKDDIIKALKSIVIHNAWYYHLIIKVPNSSYLTGVLERARKGHGYSKETCTNILEENAKYLEKILEMEKLSTPRAYKEKNSIKKNLEQVNQKYLENIENIKNSVLGKKDKETSKKNINIKGNNPNDRYINLVIENIYNKNASNSLMKKMQKYSDTLSRAKHRDYLIPKPKKSDIGTKKKDKKNKTSSEISAEFNKKLKEYEKSAKNFDNTTKKLLLQLNEFIDLLNQQSKDLSSENIKKNIKKIHKDYLKLEKISNCYQNKTNIPEKHRNIIKYGDLLLPSCHWFEDISKEEKKKKIYFFDIMTSSIEDAINNMEKKLSYENEKKKYDEMMMEKIKLQEYVNNNIKITIQEYKQIRNKPIHKLLENANISITFKRK